LTLVLQKYYICFIKFTNTNLKPNKMKASYQFTNSKGYTTRIYVLKITEKSVYYCFANEDGTPKNKKASLRMSVNSFSSFLPLTK
jgi:hypothetical protein